MLHVFSFNFSQVRLSAHGVTSSDTDDQAGVLLCHLCDFCYEVLTFY